MPSQNLYNTNVNENWMSKILVEITNEAASKIPVASFTKQDHPRLAERPLETNGRLANLSLVKEATVG